MRPRRRETRPHREHVAGRKSLLARILGGKRDLQNLASGLRVGEEAREDEAAELLGRTRRARRRREPAKSARGGKPAPSNE